VSERFFSREFYMLRAMPRNDETVAQEGILRHISEELRATIILKGWI